MILSINYSSEIAQKGDPSDAAHREYVNQIKKHLEIDNWEKLSKSFKDEPLAEFHDTPPGVLPLKCLTLFARRYKDQFHNLILNNSGRAENLFPIVEAAKHTTLIIAAELQISNLGQIFIYSRRNLKGTKTFRKIIILSP